MSRFRDALASKALVAKVTPIDLTALKLTTVTIEPSFQFKPLALAVNPGATAPSLVVEASASQGSASASISAFASGPGSSSISASAFAYVGPDGSSKASASASVSSSGGDRFVFKSASFPTVEPVETDAVPAFTFAAPAPVVSESTFDFGRGFSAPVIDWSFDIA